MHENFEKVYVAQIAHLIQAIRKVEKGEKFQYMKDGQYQLVLIRHQALEIMKTTSSRSKYIKQVEINLKLKIVLLKQQDICKKKFIKIGLKSTIILFFQVFKRKYQCLRQGNIHKHHSLKKMGG